MLAALRKSSKSWVIRILFVILIISFAAWGVGDMIQGRSRNAPAISVGDVKVSGMDYAYRYETEKRDQLRRLQRSVSDEELRQQGFPQYIARMIMSEALLTQSANDLGMVVTDDTLRSLIADQPMFRDSHGNFDTHEYNQFLRNIGKSESSFLAEQRHAIMSQQIRNAIISGLPAPQAMVDPLFHFMMEKRVVERFNVPLSATPVPNDPSDDEITAFHKENEKTYEAPEYRNLSMLLIKTADFLSQVQVEDEAITETYHQRQDEFHTAERRHLKEIVFDNEVDALAARENSADKTNLEDLAKAANPAKEVADLGWKTQSEILYPAIASTIFSLPVNQVSQPLQTPRGWLLVQTTAVEPARPQSLDEVREEISRDLAHSQAQALMFSTLNEIRDQMGGGATLEEIAEQRKLPLLKITATDINGLDPKEIPHDDLQSLGSSKTSVLTTAFQLENGTDSDLIELDDDTYYDVRVNSVTPPEIRPLDTIRERVIVDWKEKKRQDETMALARSLVERIKNGETLEAAAATVSQSVTLTPPITRRGPDNAEDAEKLSLPVTAIGPMFALSDGGIDALPSPQGAVIIRLKEVIPASLEASPDQIEQIRLGLTQSLRSELYGQFMQAQAARYDARVNYGIINRMIGGEE